MSEQTGDDVPRDPWGNPLGPDDRAPIDPQPDDYLPPFPSDPPGGVAPPGANPAWPGAQPPPQGPPTAPPPPAAPPQEPSNPAWPGSTPAPHQPPPQQAPPPWPGTTPGWGGPGVPPQHPAPPPGPNGGWAPPPGAGWAPPKNDGQAVGALVCGIVSLVCGVAGLFGLVLGPVAIGLGVSARRRVQRSRGAVRGEGMATAAIVLGCIGLGISVIYVILLIVSPELRENVTNLFDTTTTASG